MSLQSIYSLRLTVSFGKNLDTFEINSNFEIFYFFNHITDICGTAARTEIKPEILDRESTCCSG